MFVFDTSAFINGWKDHYPWPTFERVWEWVGEEMEAGRVIAPREVYRELDKRDDDIHAWMKERRHLFLDPIQDVQDKAGPIYLQFPRPGVRDAADPWVIAEADVRGFTVVTYEGRTFSGARTKNWDRQMPGVCAVLGVPCITLPMALNQLDRRL